MSPRSLRARPRPQMTRLHSCLGVWSRHLMDGVESKSIRFFLPAFADELRGREAMERLESFGEVVSGDEVAEVGSQLVVAVVVVALNRGLFDGAVHALDLAVGRGMIGCGETVVNAMQQTDPIEWMAAK